MSFLSLLKLSVTQFDNQTLEFLKKISNADRLFFILHFVSVHVFENSTIHG